MQLRDTVSKLCAASFLRSSLLTRSKRSVLPLGPVPGSALLSNTQFHLRHLSHSGPMSSALSLCRVKARRMRDGAQGERWWEHVGAEVLDPQSLQNGTCAPAGVSGLSFAPDGACSRLAHSPAGRQKKCNGLNEKRPQRLWHLNTGFPVVGTI